MWSELPGFLLRRLLPSLGVAICALVVPAVMAKPATIPGSTTTLTSTADRMISYRHQDHMWRTSDGGTHVFVNRGATPNQSSLALFSSYDDGVTWSQSVELPATNSQSTTDGYLVGNVLNVTYGAKSGQIRFSKVSYDPVARNWALGSTQIVFNTTAALAFNPAMARDSTGRVWLAFTQQDKATLNYSIKLMLKVSNSAAWTDTGLTFGAVDSLSNERSARPIATSNGMGLIYTVHQDTYWAARENVWDPDQAWPGGLVYSNQVADNDPYGSHFSAVADAQYNIHLLSVDGGRVVYSRFLDATKTWTSRVVTSDINATYLQAVMSAKTLMVVTNSNTSLRVFQSVDGGDSFANTYVLSHPPATSTINYSRPRVEAPARSTSPIPVLQQYVDGAEQRALYFSVPVVPAPAGGTSSSP
jgi:hypothetical protein